MSLLTKKPRPPKKDKTVTAGSAAKTSSWTNGSVLGSKAVGVLVVIGWLCAPLALGVVLLKPTSQPPAVVASSEAPLTPLQQSAGAYSVGFVGAWLSSSKDDVSALTSYLSVTPANLGDQPFDSRNLSVAEIVPAVDSDLVTVLVGADIYEKPVAEDPPSWIRRYFEVPVDTSGGQLSALGLPAPKSGPAAKPVQGGLGYTNQLTMSDPASETVNLLLTAYLTGQGSTSSYLTPGVQISPISPAPYTQLTPVTQYADTPPSEAPADGEAVHVQANVALQNGNSQAVTATYWVHLTARAGRWEVTDLEAAASVAAPSSSTPLPASPTPSPTGDTTEGDSK